VFGQEGNGVGLGKPVDVQFFKSLAMGNPFEKLLDTNTRMKVENSEIPTE
jgi:hypothetical protein